MAAAGLAWFAHNFSTTGFGPSDWLAAHALYSTAARWSIFSSATRAGASSGVSTARP